MADKKDYYIYVAGEKVLVSKEVYDAITQMDRQERTQSDKDKRNKLLRYEELTTDSVFGEELIYDFMQDSVEDISLRVHPRQYTDSEPAHRQRRILRLRCQGS